MWNSGFKWVCVVVCFFSEWCWFQRVVTMFFWRVCFLERCPFPNRGSFLFIPQVHHFPQSIYTRTYDYEVQLTVSQEGTLLREFRRPKAECNPTAVPLLLIGLWDCGSCFYLTDKLCQMILIQRKMHISWMANILDISTKSTPLCSPSSVLSRSKFRLLITIIDRGKSILKDK